MVLQVLAGDISPHWWSCIPRAYHDLSVSCWKTDSNERPSAEEILEKLRKLGKDCREGNWRLPFSVEVFIMFYIFIKCWGYLMIRRNPFGWINFSIKWELNRIMFGMNSCGALRSFGRYDTSGDMITYQLSSYPRKLWISKNKLRIKEEVSFF